jgi:hypothetical protein
MDRTITAGTGAMTWAQENGSVAAPSASAVRRSGGQLVASGRIPIQALLAAVEADGQEADEPGEAVNEDSEQLAATEGET